MMTQTAVDAFINQALHLALLIGCPGSAMLAWVMFVYWLRKGYDDSDNAGTWFILAVILSACAAILLFNAWYRSLPPGRAQ